MQEQESEINNGDNHSDMNQKEQNHANQDNHKVEDTEDKNSFSNDDNEYDDTEFDDYDTQLDEGDESEESELLIDEIEVNMEVLFQCLNEFQEVVDSI